MMFGFLLFGAAHQCKNDAPLVQAVKSQNFATDY